MNAQYVKRNVYQCVNGCCDIMVQPYQIDTQVYDYRSKMKKNKAGVLFYDTIENKILLVQSRGEKWGPPKGTLEGEESFEEGAIREVMEETGIVLTMDDLNACERYRIDRSLYYYLEVDSRKMNMVDNTDVVGNDASGITWIAVDCLEKMKDVGFLDLNSHCKKLLFKFFKIKIK